MSTLPDFTPKWSSGIQFEAFERLKNNDDFVTYLAKTISQEVKPDSTVHAIASLVLGKTDYDTDFAEKVIKNMSYINLGDERLELARGMIHQQGELKPEKIFKPKAAKGKDAMEEERQYFRAPSKAILPKEMEKELSPILIKMVDHLLGDKRGGFTDVEAKVLQFLNGKIDLDQFDITERNCGEYLTAIKLWDHAMAVKNYEARTWDAFQRSSYDLRTECAASGNMQSIEVYTKTLDPNQIKDREYLAVQSHWIPERAGMHTRIIANSMVQALALSRRLEAGEPSIWAVRGNVGAGKTYCVGHDDLFKKALDETGEPAGAINPDTFKGLLKIKTPELTHVQLHNEGSTLCFQYAEALSKETNTIMIIDRRLAEFREVQNDVIKRSAERSGGALLLDIDTPVETSINRILTRPKNGFDAPVPEWVIKDGYKKVKAERKKVLEEVINNDSIKYYKLYITDESGDKKLAAKKENGKFEIIPGMEKWMDEGTKEPNDKELEAIFKQRVDDDYIQIAKTRDHIPASKIKWIEQWKGLTVSEALDRQCKDLGI